MPLRAPKSQQVWIRIASKYPNILRWRRQRVADERERVAQLRAHVGRAEQALDLAVHQLVSRRGVVAARNRFRQLRPNHAMIDTLQVQVRQLSGDAVVVLLDELRDLGRLVVHPIRCAGDLELPVQEGQTRYLDWHFGASVR